MSLIKNIISNYRTHIAPLLRAQSFKNISWNLIGTVSYPFLMVLATPFFIHKLGPAQFGIWVLINSITQMMSIFNMGLGDANIRFISKFKAFEDRQEIKNIVSTTFGLSILVVFFGIILGSLLAFQFDSWQWFNISADQATVASRLIGLSFGLFSLKFMEIVVLSIFQGFERYDLFSKYSLLSRVGVLLCNLIIVHQGAGLVGIFIGSCVTQLAFLVFDLHVIHREYQFINFRPLYKKEKIKQILDFSFWMWLQSVFAMISSQADKFVVAYFSGVEVLSYYSLGYTVMTQIHAVFSSFINWIFPLVSRKTAEGLPVKALFTDSQALVLTFGFISLIGILVMSQPLFTLWLQAETYEKSSDYIQLFLYYNFFLLVNIIPYYFLNGAGYAKYNTLSELATRLLSVACMIVMFKLFGNTGLIWGQIIAIAMTTPIKTSLMTKFALHEKSAWWSLDSLICCFLIIFFFETNLLMVKVLLFGAFGWLFYFLYLKDITLSKNFLR